MTYDIVVNRLSYSPSASVQEQIATAIYNKGVLLGELQRPEQALQAYDAVIERFLSSSDVAIWGTVAQALINKACTLAGLDRSEEASYASDDLLRLIELGHCSDGHSSQFRAYALINKADCT